MSEKICLKCTKPGHTARHCTTNDTDSSTDNDFDYDDDDEICALCLDPKYMCQVEPDHFFMPMKLFLSDLDDISSPLSLNLKINKGYLINQRVDVIVVCSSLDGLRESVLRAAGPCIQKAYAEATSILPKDSMISIECPKLTCDRILFLPWTPDEKIVFTEQTLKEFLLTAVQYVRGENYTSVAFPAIGCGQYGFDADFIAQTMINHMKIENYPLNITFTIGPKLHNIFYAFQKAKRFTPVIDALPNTWSYANNVDQLRYPVAKNTQEWRTIVREFNTTMSGAYRRIIRIEHIRNDRWHKQYVIHQEDFQKRLGMNTEKFLYHGCSAVAADSIIKDYFNRSLSEENGTKYGCGVYFSYSASNSHVYSIPKNHGERCMFYARVLVGKSILGNANMKVCPSDYHTTTDGEDIYVTYHDTQAYAQYLIHYE